jgi:hypothetical protein
LNAPRRSADLSNGKAKVIGGFAVGRGAGAELPFSLPTVGAIVVLAIGVALLLSSWEGGWEGKL